MPIGPARMPLMDHLGELRRRLMICIVSLLCAAICYNLASGLAANYSSGNVSSALIGIVLLIVVVSAYGIFHFIFSSIHLFARLPVIKTLDNILGVFGGFAEGAVILYLADAILRYFVKA